MKKASVLIALAGLAGGTLLVAFFGAGRVFDAVLSVGAGGFALLLGWQVVLSVLLGSAWGAVLPGARLRVVIWGRAVRDAAGNCLPFSHVGGFVLGARAVTLFGVGWDAAAASTVVDVTAEVLGQLGFATLGLVLLLVKEPASPLTLPLAAGVALAGLTAAGIVLSRRRIALLFRALGRRVAGGWFGGSARVDRLQDELAELYGHAPRLILGSVMHMAAWVASGLSSWTAFRLMGWDIDIASALAIDGLLHAFMAASFFVPGHVGVQEAAYVGLGSIFGVPAEIALGVSLLRRARDLAVGIPVLLVWQLVEMRRLRGRARGAGGGSPTGAGRTAGMIRHTPRTGDGL